MSATGQLVSVTMTQLAFGLFVEDVADLRVIHGKLELIELKRLLL